MTARPSIVAGPATPPSAPLSGTPPRATLRASPGAVLAGRGPRERSANWPGAPRAGPSQRYSRTTAGCAGSPS
eukprot:6238027-Lingulodinium_polyedra.AAC.1